MLIAQGDPSLDTSQTEMTWIHFAMAGLGLELLLLLQMHGANPNTVSQNEVSVTQTPAVLVALRGATVYLPCTFSVLDTREHPTAKCAVQWYKTKEGQEPSRNCTLTLRTPRLSLAHPEPSLRVQNASLVIRNLTLEDTGVYYCSVTIWQKGTGQGNGTRLQVYAAPTAPQVLLQVSTHPGVTSLALICKTRGFHPSNISLIWTRDPYLLKPMVPVNQQQLLNVAANEQQVTSHLSVSPRDITGAVYTCEVRHVSLAEPLKASLCWGDVEKVLPYQLIGCLNILKIFLCVCGLVLILWAAVVKLLKLIRGCFI